MPVTLTSTALLAVFLAASSPAGGVELPSGVTLTLELEKAKAYPGEQVPFTVTLRSSGERFHNVSYPRIAAAGLSVAPCSAGSQREEDSDAEQVTRLTFQGSATAPRAGSFLLGPAEISFDTRRETPTPEAFFGAREPRRVTVAAAAVPLTVAPLPGDPPACFSGAIGSFTMHSVGKPDTVAVGDPVTLTTTITGEGELGAAACPSLTSSDLRSYPPRSLLRGKRLVCEQVVVPLKPAQLPPVSWAFFDPAVGSYRLLRKEVTGAKVVQGGSLPTSAGPVAVPLPQPHAAANGDGPHRGWSIPAALLGGAALGAPWLILKRRRPKQEVPRAARSGIEAAMHSVETVCRQGDCETFYALLFALLQQIVAQCCSQAAASVTAAPPELDLTVRDDVAALFERCDEVRYGRVPAPQSRMTEDLALLRGILRSTADASE